MTNCKKFGNDMETPVLLVFFGSIIRNNKNFDIESQSMHKFSLGDENVSCECHKGQNYLQASSQSSFDMADDL